MSTPMHTQMLWDTLELQSLQVAQLTRDKIYQVLRNSKQPQIVSLRQKCFTPEGKE